ncbi:MAG: alpha/beta hydrolase [Gammaproteobacteria bacterium]|nr:alpha/beta hydrolase [Gammaproteobacteria bacterium]
MVEFCVAEEVTQRFNGITVNANLEMASGRDFADGMVLILHGMMGHNKMELVVASQQILLENDLSSLAINLSLQVDDRHGYYDCSQPHRHLQQNAVTELALWVDWLRQRGAGKIALMAHSRGANQAMVYAAENFDPEVSHVILLAPGADDVKKSYEIRYGPIFDANVRRMQERIALNKGGEPVSNFDFWSCPRTNVTPDSFISYYGPDSKFRQFHRYLGMIRVPVLVIAGSADERFPNIPQQIGPLADDERLFLVVIENAGHFFRDLNIEEAVEAMIEFIGNPD